MPRSREPPPDWLPNGLLVTTSIGWSRLSTGSTAPPTAARHRTQGRFYIEVAAAAQSVRLTRQEIDLQSELAELQLFPGDGSQMGEPRRSPGTPPSWTRSPAGPASTARQLTEDFIAERTLGMIKAHMTVTAASGDEKATRATTWRPTVTARSDPRELAGVRERRMGSKAEPPAIGVVEPRRRPPVRRRPVAPQGHRGVPDRQRSVCLREHRDIVVGMGLIAMPALLAAPAPVAVVAVPGRPPRTGAAAGRPRTRTSLGFYDCDAAEWFRGAQDVRPAGTSSDRTSTPTAPTAICSPSPRRCGQAASFLGVVGADVPVSVFENRMLRAGAARLSDVMIVNSLGPGGGVELHPDIDRGPARPTQPPPAPLLPSARRLG